MKESAIDWAKLGQVLEQRYDEVLNTRAQQFQFWLNLMWGIPYDWGRENLFGSDCSGTLAFPLYMMGFNIRTTADRFYGRVFTQDVSPIYDPREIRAVFYVDVGGRAVHVTPVVGHGCVLQAGPRGLEWRMSVSIAEWFERKGCSAHWRQIHWGVAAHIARQESESFDVDPLLKVLRRAA